jgi:uncharacterized membrane protein
MTNWAGRPERLRVRYTLRAMLALVGLFALVFAFWKMLWLLYLIAAGPFCGAMIERAKGGEGVTGGILGGILSYCGFVIVVYVRWFYLGFVAVDAFVAFLAVFLTAALFGALVGMAIGCIVEGVADLMLGFSSRHKKVADSAANVSLFDRELPRMMSED